jgi:hypothetical protein
LGAAVVYSVFRARVPLLNKARERVELRLTNAPEFPDLQTTIATRQVCGSGEVSRIMDLGL